MDKEDFLYMLKSRIKSFEYIENRRYYIISDSDKREIKVYKELIELIERGDFDVQS